MTKNREISQEKFEKLLDWLDTDRETAGRKYEVVRTRLIKVFTLRSCQVPDELADITIDIVADKIDQIAETYSGDPMLYFYGVAKKVFSQHLKDLHRETPSYSLTQTEENESDSRQHDCLEDCLQKIKKEDRELIITYYQNAKQQKIDGRRILASELGLSPEKLRVRIHRIKAVLEKCVRQCLEE